MTDPPVEVEQASLTASAPDAAPAEVSSGQLLARLMHISAEHRAGLLERYAGLGILIALFIIFTITLPGTFLSWNNLTGVVANQTIAGIMALALLLPLAAGAFDISIGGMMTLAVVVVTWLFQQSNGKIPIPLAIVITLLVGVVVGCINGLLVVGTKVDPFIATLGTSTVLLGISELVANGTTIALNIPSSFTALARHNVGRIPITVLYVAVLGLIVWYLLDYTPLGRKIYATGFGREAARLSGVRTGRVVFAMFICSAVLASLAGVVYGARLGSGPPNTGAAYLLPAFAACFLGSTMIKPGRFNVPGVVVAVFIVAIGTNGLQLYGIPFWVVDVFQGSALIVAVVLARLRSIRT
jgi:ribose transport system permease protein